MALQEPKVHLDSCLYPNWAAANRPWLELPLLYGPQCLVIQAKAKTSNNADIVGLPIGPDLDSQDNGSLHPRLSGFLGVLRFDPKAQDRSRYALAETVDTVYASSRPRT